MCKVKLTALIMLCVVLATLFFTSCDLLAPEEDEETEPAVLEVSPTTLNFRKTSTQKTLTISNSGGGQLEWTLSDNKKWINCYPTEGTCAGFVTSRVDVYVTRAHDFYGKYSGTITVNGGGMSKTVTVEMEVE